MEKLVQQLGLEDTEAKVYLSLLELGPSTVSEITKHAGITRTLGYHVLEKLGLYGLVTRSSGSKKKIQYAAEHPRSLVQFIKHKRERWDTRVRDVEQLLPDLVSLYKIAEKPVLRYQEGRQGIISLFEESLESKTEILSVMDVESWKTPSFWEWARQYNRERNKRKIKERILILDTPEGRQWVKSYHGSLTYTVYRWVDPKDVQQLLQFGGELNVYENRVVMALLRPPHQMCVVMESSVLAGIMKAMFELVWQHARPVFPLKQREKSKKQIVRR